MMRLIPQWQKTPKYHYVMLGLITFLSVFPFYWMFIVSSNTDAEISKSPPSLVPGPRFLEVAQKVLNAEGVYFSQALINTFITTTEQNNCIQGRQILHPCLVQYPALR